MILEVLMKVLISRGLSHPDQCVRQLAAWVRDGSLAAEVAKDPTAVLACVIHAVAVLSLAAVSDWHDHSDTEQPSPRFAVFTAAATTEGEDPASAVVTTAATVAAMDELAAALGVAKPFGERTPIEGPFVSLILQQLLAYAAAHAPELIEAILEAIRARKSPVIGG